MPTPPLSLTLDGPVATLRLNRPPVNAFNSKQLDRFEDALVRIQTSEQTQVVVVRASGRHFCAGADIREMSVSLSKTDMSSANGFAARIQHLFHRLAELAVPTVALVHGAAVGGGLELAAACDLRIATESARFALPEVRLGLVPAGGGTQRLTSLIGRGAANRLMLTGESIDGRTAERLGLIQWCVPDDELEEAGSRVVTALRAGSGPAQAEIKRCVGLAGTATGFFAELESQERLHRNRDTLSRVHRFVTERGMQ